jgi:hypothetical protein
MLGFTSPGASAGFNGAGYSVHDSPGLTSNVAGLSAAGQAAGDTYQQLYGTVAPGFNDLLRTRLADLNDQASKAYGNLEQNLAARRVMGSSFGNDTITRAHAEFSKQRDAVTADNFLQSLNAQMQLTQQQLAARNVQFGTGIQQANFDSGLAAQLTSGGQTAMNQAAQLNAQLQSNYQAGMGKLFGVGAGLLAAPFTGGASLALAGLGSSSLFGGLSGSNNAGWSAPLSSGSFV